LIFRNIKF